MLEITFILFVFQVFSFYLIFLFLTCHALLSLPMKDKMGIHHSSFNCERLSTSLHNCFGIDSSPHQFESENDKKNPNSSPTSSNDNFVDVASVQPKKTITSKNRSSKETCCCPVANYDDFPYKACGPSPVSEVRVIIS